MTNLIRLDIDHIIPACKVLTDSFFYDPLYIYLFPDENKRKENLLSLFYFRLFYSILYGEVYSTSKSFEGIAAWVPYENVYPSIRKLIKSKLLLLIKRIGIVNLLKSSIIKNYVDKIHKSYSHIPHWHLTPIGIDPKFQRKGYGKLLIKYKLQEIDNECQSCYLETYNPDSLEFYKNFGFKLLNSYKINKTNLVFWTMLREKNS
jgi:GNAT superfamily N-acetyltransferase